MPPAESIAGLAALLQDRYRVERELGAGGMARVYLAEDLKHHRRVAIKVMRPEVAKSMGAQRFLREVEIVARLTHPHILPLHDSGEAGGMLYYVMPYVEGESLRVRLARGLELSDAVRILRDVAEALAYSHAQGVVHRDIKPENVLLGGGHAVVADFGIARALHEASQDQRLTTGGLSLGTPAYMSPEQVAADPAVNHRADIYALGVMAYEMFVGEAPFAGESPAAVLAAHIARAPVPLQQRRSDLPPELASLVMRCLEKDPADRWSSAGEIVERLEQFGPPFATPTGLVPAVRASSRRRWLTGAIAVAMVATAGAAAWGWWGASAPTFVLGRAIAVTRDPGLEVSATFSPDGKFLAYLAGDATHFRLFVRPVEGTTAIPLTLDDVTIHGAPAWSPDGNLVAYSTGAAVWVVPPLGGAPRQVLHHQGTRLLTGVTWSLDGRSIAWAAGDSLFLSPASGGEARALTTARDLHSCRFSPSGRWIACVSDNSTYVSSTRMFGNTAVSRIVVAPTGGGAARAVSDSSSLNQSPAWGRSDDVLFFVSDRDGPRDVFVQGLSLGRARGSARRITAGLGAYSIHVSGDGRRMTYSAFQVRSNIWSIPIPASGTASVTASAPLTKGGQTVETMGVSRDGRWVLFDSDLAGNSDIYRIPVSGGAQERLTTDTSNKYAPSLSPDGRLLAYHSPRSGTRDIYVLPLDGGPVQTVTSSPAQEGRPAWSFDGRDLAFVDVVNGDLWLSHVSVDGGWGAPRLLSQGGTTRAEDCLPAPDWSPIARELAYCYDAGIRVMTPDDAHARDVYRPDTTAGRPRVDWVVWSRSGTALFFRGHQGQGPSGVWTVGVRGDAPRLLVRFDDPSHPSSFPFIAADRTRLYFTRSERESDVWIADLAPR